MPVLILPLILVGILLGPLGANAPPDEVGESCNMMGIPEETLTFYKIECIEDEKGNLHELVFF